MWCPGRVPGTCTLVMIANHHVVMHASWMSISDRPVSLIAHQTMSRNASCDTMCLTRHACDVSRSRDTHLILDWVSTLNLRSWHLITSLLIVSQQGLVMMTSHDGLVEWSSTGSTMLVGCYITHVTLDSCVTRSIYMCMWFAIWSSCNHISCIAYHM